LRLILAPAWGFCNAIVAMSLANTHSYLGDIAGKEKINCIASIAKAHSLFNFAA